MTKSIVERLREFEGSECDFAKIFDCNCLNSTTCKRCFKKVANTIADEIEREKNEIIEAQNKGSHYIIKKWAEINGMPMKDDETITQWLDRWTIMLPRYEDGEPIQSGDEFVVDLCDGKEVATDANYIVAALDSSCAYLLNDYDGYMEDSSYRFKRPTPKVLDADGVELKVGEIPYSKRYGTKRPEIKSVHRAGDKNYTIDKDFVIYVNNEFDYADDLIHRFPVFDADGVEINVGDTVWFTANNVIHFDWIVKEIVDGKIELERGTGSWSVNNPPEILTHERPVFDANNERIKVGDTVWHKELGGSGTVTMIKPDGKVMVDWDNKRYGLCTEEAIDLTHCEPDSLEKLRDEINITIPSTVTTRTLTDWRDRLTALME